METVFKKGQTVYDQIYRKGEKGIVWFVSINKYKPFVFVNFEDSKPAIYTLEGVFMDVSKNETIVGSFPTLSTAPYEVDMKGFEQKAPPPSVEDANDWLRAKGGFYDVDIDYRKARYTSPELYIAFEALRCLIVLRDYYNNGWKVDWTTEDWKCFIYLRRVHPIIEFGMELSATIPHVLSFNTRRIASKFLEEQRELLEMAAPLL